MSSSKNKQAMPVSFAWTRSSSLYSLDGNTAVYKAGGPDQYRPVVSGLAMAPNTGRYFYEIRINCDNTRVGICGDNIDLDGEMGKIPDCVALNMQNGQVDFNGVELKKLWRLVTPVSGGVLGFVYDSNEGTLQVYFNGEYHGTVVGPEVSFKGRVAYACIGLAGLEVNNRNIGVGKKHAIVNPAPEISYQLV